MTQYAKVDGSWMAVPDNWTQYLPPGTETTTTPPAGSTLSTQNPLDWFRNMLGPLNQGLDQPTLGPPVHWTPGPAPYVPFMQQPQMPQSIDIQRFISPAVQNLWAQLPPPTPIPQYPTDPNAPGGIPGSGPGGEPLVPLPPPGPTPIVPPPGYTPPGPTPIVPPPGYTQPVLQPDPYSQSVQQPATWYDPYQIYPQQTYPTLQPAPTYSPTLAPWTDVSMLPSSPSGSMAGWDSGALY